MGWDLSKLTFLSTYPIDKVVATGTFSVTNSGATGQSPQTALVVSGTTPNPYAKRCFVRASWSVDGGANYQSLDSQLVYTFNMTTIPPAPAHSAILNGLQAAASIGVSDSLITFTTANGYHGDVTDNGTVYAFTPISQTFLFKYALFEIS